MTPIIDPALEPTEADEPPLLEPTADTTTAAFGDHNTFTTAPTTLPFGDVHAPALMHQWFTSLLGNPTGFHVVDNSVAEPPHGTAAATAIAPSTTPWGTPVAYVAHSGIEN